MPEESLSADKTNKWLLPDDLVEKAASDLKGILPEELIKKIQNSHVGTDHEIHIAVTKKEINNLYRSIEKLEVLYYGFLLHQIQQGSEVDLKAFFLATILHFVYAKLLGCQQQADAIKKDIAHFNLLLKGQFNLIDFPILSYGLSISESPLPQAPKTLGIEVWIKDYLPDFLRAREFRTNLFIKLNWFRLLILRVQRVAINLALMVPLFNHVASGIQAVTRFLRFAIVAWVFYLPRFILNIILLGKHSIAHAEMTPEEKSVNWYSRLAVQWSRRRFQLLNDGVWFTVNLITTLVVQSVALNLTAILYIFDVLNALWDVAQCLSAKNSALKAVSSLDSSYHCSIQTYANAKLKEKAFSLVISVVLLVGMVPIITILPHFVPILLAGAALVLVTMILQMAIQKYFVAQRPDLTIVKPFGVALASVAQEECEHLLESPISTGSVTPDIQSSTSVSRAPSMLDLRMLDSPILETTVIAVSSFPNPAKIQGDSTEERYLAADVQKTSANQIQNIPNYTMSSPRLLRKSHDSPRSPQSCSAEQGFFHSPTMLLGTCPAAT